jgi:hypothetical protein
MVVSYEAHIHNNTPLNGIFPEDVFTGATVPRHRLLDYHVWGCPVYVLVPKMQAGKKLPVWEPRSRRGMFMGISSHHTNEVPQVLNLITGSITTQYHVVFDDLFSTVTSVEREHDPHNHWEELCLDNAVQIRVYDPPDFLDDELLTREELDSKRGHLNRQEIRQESAHGVQVERQDHVLPTARNATSDSTMSIFVPIEEEETNTCATPTFIKKEGVSTPEGASASQGASATPPGTSAPPSDGLRRSTRSFAGTRQTPRYTEAFLSKVDTFGQNEGHQSNMAYLAEIHTDQKTGEVDISDPLVYRAKRKADPDMPTFHEALRGNHAEQYIEAMKIEVKSLLLQKLGKPLPERKSPI